MQLTQELTRTLLEQHSLDAAHVLERYPPNEAWLEIAELDTEQATQIIEAFSPAYAARLLVGLESDTRTQLIRELPSEASVDILEYIPDDLKGAILTELPSLHAEELETLTDYEEDSAGSVMSPDYVALREEATVADAIRRLRRMALVGAPATYIYIVDDEGLLRGVLIMRDLVLSKPQRLLRDIMISNVVSVAATESLNDVADLLQERNLLAVPVVDGEEKLVGVISANQLVSELQEEGFEDAQKMFGAGSDEHASSPTLFTIRKRLPWLEVNLATAFLAAAVVGAFDGLIAQMTILAAFLPVVAGQGGNAGAQALAVMLRSLAREEVDARHPRKVLVKEGLVGLVNGLVTGFSAGVIASLISGNLVLGAVVALAMTLNLVIAGISGAGIPIVMERLGQDPAQSSNIILTTVTDVLGFATFLGLALLARPWLINI